MNSYGNIFRVTTFGESHGPAIGGVIDGVPAGFPVDVEAIQQELDRRKPGQSEISTARKESDRIEILSGIFEGLSTGTPVGFMIRNSDHHSSDYGQLRRAYRPGHADFTYTAKYGLRDHRGGGRSSARETACRVAAGALAKQILASEGITIHAYTSQIGTVRLDTSPDTVDTSLTESNPVRCPDAETARLMTEEILQARRQGDTLGGIVTCIINGCPAGLGDPTGDKLSAQLACAMLSINAAKGFDYGLGFECASRRGSEMTDPFVSLPDGTVATSSNYSGGIQGGISNGMPIYFRVAFKPVATLLRPVPTINCNGESMELQMKGRHDPCVVPRAVPVVEAMAAITVLDALLRNRLSRIR